jgi:hypothetical protein
LDRAYLHNRYLNEEAFEGNTSSLQTAAGSTNFDANFNKIINLAPPTNSLDAANKNYVDDKLALSGTSLSGFNKSTHTGDNATTTFTLSFTPQTGTASAFRVAIDGVLQTPDEAYTINTGASTITFTSAPPTNAEIVVIATGTAQDVNGIGVTATGSTIARRLDDRFSDVIDPKDHGVVGDGTTDDTANYDSYIENVQSKLGSFSNLSDSNLHASYHQFKRKRGNNNACNGQYAYKFPYAHYDGSPVVDQTNYSTAQRRIVVESGDLLIRLKFKGYINQFKVQLFGASFLAQFVSGLVDAGAASGRRVDYSDDDLEKTVIFKVPRIIGAYKFGDADVRNIKLELNSIAGDQDSYFDLIAIDYGWTNNKNVYAIQPKLDFGFKGIAMRNWNDGTSSATGDDGAFFMDTDTTAKHFIDTLRRFTERHNDLDWVRFPIQYKYLYDSGNIAEDRIKRVIGFLNYCSDIGVNAIVVLNHGFNDPGFSPEKWIQASDLDTAAERTNMASYAGIVSKYIVNHPAVVGIELENEHNGFLIGREDANSVSLNSVQVKDYLVKLSTEMRTITSKPLFIGYSGAIHHTLSFWSDLDTFVDGICINAYGANRTHLLDTELPIVAFESEGNNVTSTEGSAQVVGVWNSFIDPFYGTANQTNRDTFNQYRPPSLGKEYVFKTLSMSQYNGRVVYDSASLSQITDAVNREKVYLISTDNEYRYNDDTDSWAVV